MNASRPFEHPPVRRKNVKTFRWDHRRQIQNLFMVQYLISRSPMVVTLGQQYKYRGEAHRYTVCVCVFSSHPFWTSSSLDVPAGVTQKEGHTGFLIHLPSAVRALIFVARRIQPFLSLVDREVEFCVLTN